MLEYKCVFLVLHIEPLHWLDTEYSLKIINKHMKCVVLANLQIVKS